MIDKMSFGFDRYIIEFPKTLQFEIFNERHCNGITFYKENYTYQLVHNNVDWNRIIINGKDGFWHDLPFKPDTWLFLPNDIVIKETNEYYRRN